MWIGRFWFITLMCIMHTYIGAKTEGEAWTSSQRLDVESGVVC